MNIIAIIALVTWVAFNILNTIGAAAAMRRTVVVENKRTPLWWLLFGLAVDNAGFVLLLATTRYLRELFGDWALLVVALPHTIAFFTISYFLAYLLGLVRNGKHTEN